ncbi:EAL domain-containing protein [Bacillus sp. BRMEA1]|uniref:EAL domain-containing protein n=1 Tax=Neobacillus endophyticus TaxID=2738405 RepID=UPI001566A03B|nr:EAL domain-containing protein [Neobacillus endophyticus]NRD79030.1 EAL domain-containing protein [Neobacillus endophyticus]
MSMKKKILIFMSILFLLSFLVLYFMIRLLILNTFETIEKKDMTRSLDTVLFNVNQTEEDMKKNLINFTIWDDTYHFAKFENPDYIKINLTDDAYSFNQFNLVAITNAQGSLLYGASFDLKKGEKQPFPPDFLPLISQIGSVNAGIVMIKNKPMMVVSEPIIKSDETGPSDGVMIVGRWIDQEEVSILAKKSQSELSIVPIKSHQQGKWIQIDSENTISGYSAVSDVYGNPAFVFRVKSERTTYATGRKSIILFSVFMGVLMLFSFYIIHTFMDKAVLSRINELVATIRDIKTRRDFSKRLPAKGKDEVSRMIQEFNQMMISLEYYEGMIRHQAFYDSLTDLPNRLQFYEKLNEMIEVAKIDYAAFYVLFVDLDKFKEVNDTYGHDAGDLLLQHVAEVLKQLVPNDALISRLGGDEYTILLSGNITETEVKILLHRVLIRLNEPFVVDENTLHISASIGLSVYPKDGETAEDLVKHADQAMYSVKKSGRNNYAVFEHQTTAPISVEALRKALINGEFFLLYQPRVEVSTGVLRSAEVLIRWEHPDQGVLLPEAFLPVVEESGLMAELGERVLLSACSQIMIWKKSVEPELKVSIAVPDILLHREQFVKSVKTVLTKSGLSARDLVFEVTAHLFEPTKTAYKNLVHLKQLGVNIGIREVEKGDLLMVDVATFSLDYVKISPTLIDQMHKGMDSVTVKTLIDWCRVQRITSIAEGVETQSQRDRLLKYGCDMMQGPIVEKPVSPEKFVEWWKKTST